ncbi:hypothetical protein, partial [Klebsiella pneumoniae]|uniref:hypothetical protein n=1 Tax=Klebsiella pneumoniae TaxID=573 RepID=UPI003A859DE3
DWATRQSTNPPFSFPKPNRQCFHKYTRKKKALWPPGFRSYHILTLLFFWLLFLSYLLPGTVLRQTPTPLLRLNSALRLEFADVRGKLLDKMVTAGKPSI